MAAVAGLLREGGAAPVARLRERRQALSDARRFEEAARVRDAESALRRVAGGLRALRRARRRHGVVLAPHLDPRLVQGFAVAHGLVVARRPLPRAGRRRARGVRARRRDRPRRGAATGAGPLAVPAERADELRLVHATFGRPPAEVAVVPFPPDAPRAALVEALAAARLRVPPGAGQGTGKGSSQSKVARRRVRVPPAE